MTAEQVLFNPGPVVVPAQVWAGLHTGDLCHREPEQLDRLGRVRAKLLRVCGGEGSHGVALLTGSGTCALEAAIATAVQLTGRALVLDNGNYGERLRDIVSARGLPHQHLQVGWGRPFDLRAVSVALERGDFTHVLMVHHETSTGMLNPLHEVAELARQAGCELIVDAVSSVGAEQIDVQASGITWLVGSSNKCLEGLPGMSFVCVELSAIGRHRESRPGLYLDVRQQYEAQQARGEPVFTPAVQVMAAFEAALDVAIAEGVQARGERYLRHTSRLRDAAPTLGLTPLLSEGDQACSTTVFRLPAGVTYQAFHDEVKARGFIVYHCPPRMGDVVRIATMGQLTDGHVTALLGVMAEVLAQLRAGAR